ncbi:hypothetical protein C2G38_2186132 [Gigaspora rosea]|uniref:Uncharacterized protein n=1 Tax=Gigaspora rosea TaxID=44941 RepID=A0A397V8C3_9GLOM|nr:hypothetical protein C2G38_2186132 [Gigaspora rosea]
MNIDQYKQRIVNHNFLHETNRAAKNLFAYTVDYFNDAYQLPITEDLTPHIHRLITTIRYQNNQSPQEFDLIIPEVIEKWQQTCGFLDSPAPTEILETNNSENSEDSNGAINFEDHSEESSKENFEENSTSSHPSNLSIPTINNQIEQNHNQIRRSLYNTRSPKDSDITQRLLKKEILHKNSSNIAFLYSKFLNFGLFYTPIWLILYKLRSKLYQSPSGSYNTRQILSQIKETIKNNDYILPTEESSLSTSNNHNNYQTTPDYLTDINRNLTISQSGRNNNRRTDQNEDLLHFNKEDVRMTNLYINDNLQRGAENRQVPIRPSNNNEERQNEEGDNNKEDEFSPEDALKSILEGLKEIVKNNAERPTTSTNPKKYKMIDFPTFSGNQDEDPVEWVEAFTRACVGNNISENRRLAIVPNFFKSNALSCLEHESFASTNEEESKDIKNIEVEEKPIHSSEEAKSTTAYLLYSFGTTRVRKGIELTHTNITVNLPQQICTDHELGLQNKIMGVTVSHIKEILLRCFQVLTK